MQGTRKRTRPNNKAEDKRKEEETPVTLQTTDIFTKIEGAVQGGYTTISLQGSSRSGKTYNVVIWLFVYALTHPKSRFSIIRKTLPALKGSVLVDFKEVAEKIGVLDVSDFNKSDLVFTLPNGSTFEFFSADNEQKLRGRKRDILFVNEANELTALEFQQLKLRTTRFAIIDYNPSFSDEHWIAREVNRDPRTYHFITTYRDNPFLEQTVIDEIESLKDKNRSLWTIYGLGQQALPEGLVFTNWDTVATFPKRMKPQYIGVDFGFKQDPTAIIRVAKEGDDLFLEEIAYRTELLTSDIIRILKENITHEGQNIISESADPRLVEEIHNAGLNIYPVKKYPGSVQAGIMQLQQYRIHITENSYNAIKEMKNYTYMQDKDGRWLNTPVDAYNHIADALRYVVMERYLGHRPPKQINLQKLSKVVY